MTPFADPDVAIVGASAAGLFTAYELARQGHAVAVYETAPRIAPSRRTLIVTHHLRGLLGPLAEPAVVNSIRQFELLTADRTATVPLQTPDLVIDRAIVIETLARACQAAGVRLFTGHRIVGLRRERGDVVLDVQHERHVFGVRPRVIVGADGAFSTVAKGAGWAAGATVPLVQAVVSLPAGFPPDTTRVWFMPDDTPYFYWLIPESATRGVLGLIGEDGRRTRRCLERFVARERLDVLEFQAARIPAYTRWTPVHRRLGATDIYLVGDAAGQVKVTTVGGMVTGFRGARAVVEAVRNGAPGPELRRLRRELDLHLRIRRALQRFTARDYARLMDLLSAPVVSMLGSVSRDEARRVLAELCIREPRLLFMGLRALIEDWLPGRAAAPPVPVWVDESSVVESYDPS